MEPETYTYTCQLCGNEVECTGQAAHFMANHDTDTETAFAKLFAAEEQVKVAGQRIRDIRDGFQQGSLVAALSVSEFHVRRFEAAFQAAQSTGRISEYGAYRLARLG